MDGMVKILRDLLVRMSLRIPYERSDMLSFCYDSGKVISAEYTVEGIEVEAEIAREFAPRLQRYEREG
jgi:50S ribosomal subunit-associated GTPase HflX